MQSDRSYSYTLLNVSIEEDSDPEQAQRDKDMQRIWHLASISKGLKLTQTTNLNLLSNSGNKTEVTNQRHPVFAQNGYIALTEGMWSICKGMQEAKRIKDTRYHKKKMMIGTVEDVDDMILEANLQFHGKDSQEVQNHDENNVFANERRHSKQPESINDTICLEKDDRIVNSDYHIYVNNVNQVDPKAAVIVLMQRVALVN
ncbi:hypothetical protein Tco_0701409 [Tanacetum coccineum]